MALSKDLNWEKPELSSESRALTASSDVEQHVSWGENASTTPPLEMEIAMDVILPSRISGLQRRVQGIWGGGVDAVEKTLWTAADQMRGKCAESSASKNLFGRQFFLRKNSLGRTDMNLSVTSRAFSLQGLS